MSQIYPSGLTRGGRDDAEGPGDSGNHL